MKAKYSFFSVLLTVVFCFQSCSKDDVGGTLDNGQKFYLNIDGFVDDQDNTKMSINNTWTKMLFDEGDIVYINNVQFRIYLDEHDRWCASRVSGSDSILGETFTCYYIGSHVSKSGTIFDFAEDITGSRAVNRPEYQDPATGKTVTHNLSYCESSVVLAGITHDSIITVRPACAIIRFHGDAISGGLRIGVGFDSAMVVRKGSITPSDNDYASITATKFFSQVKKVTGFGGKLTVKGDMLVALNQYAESDDYYVAVPVESPTGITTSLFVEVYDGRDFYYEKFTNVTLRPGRVFTININ